MTKIDFENLPKVVAIVGSREFTKPQWIKKFVMNLKPGTIVVSGGAKKGVDLWVKQFVKGYTTQEDGKTFPTYFPAIRNDLHYKELAVEDFEWNQLGKFVGHVRNEILVLWVERMKGMVFVFGQVSPETSLITGGSLNVTVNCVKHRVPYEVFKSYD